MMSLDHEFFMFLKYSTNKLGMEMCPARRDLAAVIFSSSRRHVTVRMVVRF